jgi:predicted glycosyltransferase
MNILFEVNHPGQVHLLRHTYHQLLKRNHKLFVITKKDKMINHLLDFYNISYILLGEKGSGIHGKIFKQLHFDFQALKLVLKHKITLGVGSSITNDHVAAITKMNSIHLSDDDPEMVPLINNFSYPFADVILSPDCLSFLKYKNKNIGYAGYHELAYLHPNRFNPNPEVIHKIGIKETDTFFILRFVALIGHHDHGHAGISLEQKRKLIELLKPHGRIFITSEKNIEPEFEEYRLPVPPEDIHSLMYYATMFLGDSQTMTSEAAILGTPALKCNTFAGKLSVPNQIEDKYGLCYSYQPSDFHAFFNHTKQLIETKDLKKIWAQKRQIFLNDKIDVTSFFVWFIENYPASLKTIREDSAHQYNFR